MNSSKLIAKLFNPFKKIPLLPNLFDEQLKVITLFFNPKVFANMIELNSWIKSLKNVKTKYHKLGGLEFIVNDKEICHIHGDGLVDVKLNKSLKNKFKRIENIENHHVLPNSNMISYQIAKNDDLIQIKEIIKIVYELNLNTPDTA